MSEEKKDIEFVTADTPVKEFISKDDKNSKTSKQMAKDKRRKKLQLESLYHKNTKTIWYTACIGSVLAFILISVFGLHIPLVTVGILVLLEACFVKCFEGLPIWAHMIFAFFQLILGIAVTQVLFMVLADVLYFVCLNFSNYLKSVEKKKAV